MSQYWSEHIHALEPYTPGEQPLIEGLIKLNTNESPYGPSPATLTAIQLATNEDLRKYPDPNGTELKQTLADHHDLNVNQVFVGNSSDEVLGHAFRAFFLKDQPLLMPDLTYSFYPVYCRLFGISYESVALNEKFEVDPADYRRPAGGIVFANPNAPTGHTLNIEQLTAMVAEHPECVVLIDEAYADFSGQSAIELVNQFPNVLVTQTFSKSRCLAGLRVGMAFGQADLIDALERVKNSFHPYALNRLALAGATAAIQDDAYYQDCIARIKQTRDNATARLAQLGFDVLPSQANFVLARHPKQAALELFDHLRQHKILVLIVQLGLITGSKTLHFKLETLERQGCC